MRIEAGSGGGRDGFGLTTAEITYRLPDYLHVVQTFVWQEYDVWPLLPALRRFLCFWRDEIDGPLVAVRVAHCDLVGHRGLSRADAEFLH